MLYNARNSATRSRAVAVTIIHAASGGIWLRIFRCLKRLLSLVNKNQRKNFPELLAGSTCQEFPVSALEGQPHSRRDFL